MDKQSSVRETGYYWCLYDTVWDLCYYDNLTNKWTCCGDNFNYSECIFDEIDEKRIIREE